MISASSVALMRHSSVAVTLMSSPPPDQTCRLAEGNAGRRLASAAPVAAAGIVPVRLWSWPLSVRAGCRCNHFPPTGGWSLRACGRQANGTDVRADRCGRDQSEPEKAARTSPPRRSTSTPTWPSKNGPLPGPRYAPAPASGSPPAGRSGRPASSARPGGSTPAARPTASPSYPGSGALPAFTVHGTFSFGQHRQPGSLMLARLSLRRLRPR